ncbi:MULTISPECIES: TatD family hydrolase [unclassified Adlercreutzia]|uniref:TatD family hydrolase n=1 Tax=unclassified Adlercreutzia TaxID=2636013 RepID=UPI001F15426B|nr:MULTISPECIES: TatD family hydrolase [unclassified Adlercreutzia]
MSPADPTNLADPAKRPVLYDLHCHVDFAASPEALARDAAALGVRALSCTVTPEGYVAARELLAEGAGVRVGLGMHPWWVADGRVDAAAAAQFEKLAPQARFIGEVGLDFAGERGREECRARQHAALERALAACCGKATGDAAGQGGRGGAGRGKRTAAASATPKVISLHAVRAAGDVLDALERSGALGQHACVLHWFSGTSDELTRAMRAGCLFSVGPRMLASKRGRAYARAIPEGRLLLETDSPARAGESWSAEAWRAQLEEALRLLAEARGADERSLAEALAATSERLLA